MRAESNTPTQQVIHLLVVDDESMIRANLKEYLTQYHESPYTLDVDEAATAQEALDRLSQKHYDILISDINLPDQDGFYVIKHSLKLQPNLKTALLTSYDLDSYIKTAKEYKVYNIITKTAPFNFDELSQTINNLVEPQQALGLENYIKDPVKPLTMIKVKRSHDIMPANNELRKFIEDFHLPDIEALSVALVEAITNAVYHGPKNELGTDLYIKGQEIDELPEDHVVTIKYGYDTEKLGIAIHDQAGSLKADDLLFWLERNISGDSLMDTHGRGIYLMYRLIDRLIINLHKGKATELIMIHYLHETVSDNKPLYINQY